MKESVLSDKSFAFSLRIIKLYKYMPTELREFVLSKQVLRSGTSIGANVEESKHAQSKLDFISTLSIAQKEAIETNYWSKLPRESDYLTHEQADSILIDCDELQRLLTASIRTAKQNLKKEK